MRPLLQEPLPAHDSGWVWRFDHRLARPAHFHPQLELLLIERGQARVELWGGELAVSEGQLIWLFPGVAHSMCSFTPDFTMWGVELQPQLVLRALGQRTRSAYDNPYRWIQQIPPRMLIRPQVSLVAAQVRVIAELCQGWRAPSERILEELLQAAWDFSVRTSDPLVALEAKALHTLMAEPDQDREAVSKGLGVSPQHVSRIFRSRLSCTLETQRAHARVVRFLALFDGTRRSLLDASTAAGFGDYSQLYRVFLDYAGYGPREYLTGAGRAKRALILAPARMAK